MKELIDKLYLGIIEYDMPEIKVSTSKIETVVKAASVYEDYLYISSENNVPAKGIVYSSSEKVKIINKNFYGTEVAVKYVVDTMYSEKGERLEGFINIVSNGGEIAIPFDITVGQTSADTTIGNVKNLFHFTNLVQTSYDEALNLFLSPRFKEVFLKDNLQLSSVYDGLVGAVNKDAALEEFLIAAKKKTPVNITLLDKSREYSDISENYGDFLILSKNNWGYARVEVSVKGDFIRIDKKEITSLDFAGSNYELNFYIDAERLHAGNNYGAIVFKGYGGEQTAVIKIVNGSNNNKDSLLLKKYTCELENTYLDFRLRKITGNVWQEKSLDIIKRMRSISDDSVFIKLFLAQIYITKGQDSEASWLLENAAEQLIARRDENVELYCYYLYIRTIERREPDFTAEMLKKIKQYYGQGHDNWKILWILLYLDESYDSNISLKLTRIKEQYSNGMRTPLMYFEALSVFNEYPEFLRIINDFELQVLKFGAKEKAISKKLAKQISDMAAREKRFNNKLFGIMEALYEMYGELSILEAVVQMLIRGNKNEKKYFKWYDLAVQKEIKVTGLYEYFIQTLPENYDKLIPQVVLLYFTYNDLNNSEDTALAGRNISSRRLAILYRNVIEHKNKIPFIYNMYEKQMELFAIDGILNDKIDENYSVIYGEMLRPAMVNEAIAEKLPAIINTYMIECKNPYIKEVLVYHKELKECDRVAVIGNKAYVTIYTDNAAIIYVDLYGNRYTEGEYGTVTKLMNLEQYMQFCFDISVKSDGMLLYFCDKYLNYGKNNGNSIEILKFVSKLNTIKKDYKILLEKEIVDYYAMNYDGDVVDTYLEGVEAEHLTRASRVKIIELMIVRGLYNRAFEFMKEYGYSDIEPGRVLKCCSKLIEQNDYEYDEALTEMAFFAYKKGKYNERVLKYIGEYFYGTTKDMLDIWKAYKNFQCESRELDEKIIAQIIFTGECASAIGRVFDEYCRKGASYKVKKAVMVSRSYEYFAREKIIDDIIFKHIHRELLENEELIDICKLAYVKHCSEEESLNKEQLDICRKIIYEMCKKGKKFDFYRRFKDYFSLPLDIIDKFVVEYRTRPKNRVFIHYIIEKGDLNEKSYTVKEMNEVCNGVFTFEYVMFYGENFKYYISEEGFGEKIISESKNIYIGEKDDISEENRYGMLNNMMLCREMGEDTTLLELTSDYYVKMQLNKEMFEIK